MKLAFVIPWYGKDAAGGAENECRSLAHGIKEFFPQVQVEVFATCLKEYSANWNENVLPEGISHDGPVLVRRFKTIPSERDYFDKLNRRLMHPGTGDLWRDGRRRSPIPWLFEHYYIRKMLISPEMTAYIRKSYDEYDFFIFMPYMFATTYFGVFAARKKAIIIPCLHNERYAYMGIYQKMMRAARLSLYLGSAEMRLAERLYKLSDRTQILLGATVNTNVAQGDAMRFKLKYHLNDPFILYTGRKIPGKNLPLLVEYFKTYRRQTTVHQDLRLVIVGKGALDYSIDGDEHILDLGFIPEQDKLDAMKAAAAFCMPSTNESFSIVLMEAWLQQTPAFVHAACDVTREHCEASGGGLCFSDQETFNAGLDLLLTNPAKSRDMGKRGGKYVLENFTKEKITRKLMGALQSLKG